MVYYFHIRLCYILYLFGLYHSLFNSIKVHLNNYIFINTFKKGNI